MIPPKQEERTNSSAMPGLRNACPKELKLGEIYGNI
jgi:hypothetical protein